MNDSLERLEDELRRCIDAHAQFLDYTRQSPSARFMEESLKILRKDQTKWITS